MLAGMVIVAMMVGALATILAVAASLPIGVALLLYPAAGSTFLMFVIAVRVALGAAHRPAAARQAAKR